MIVYLVDIGVLLAKDDDEFESYACAYDKKHGYYDEEQFYEKDLEKAKDIVRKYLADAKPELNSYGIVSVTHLPDDIDLEDCCVEDETYLVSDIEFDLAKINGELVEGFVDRTN